MSLKNPEYLWFLLLLVPMIVYYVCRQAKSDASLKVSSTRPFVSIGGAYKRYFFHALFVLRLAAIALLIVVIARPQISNKTSTQSTQGIDIVMALDLSGSMLAEDLKPNRLEAAKDVAIEFIASRPDDNIGLVVFAGESFTQCPLTTDHGSLINLLKGLKYDMIEDGTAIGSGLATAVARIKDSKAKSKVIILLTDGTNNKGTVSPLTAAEMAATFGIRVYTIGAGTHGMARYPFNTVVGVRYQNVPVEIDEDVLKDIAETTKGHYFRATDTDNLHEVYHEIDQMEKTKLRVKEYSRKDEEYFPYLFAALLLLITEFLVRTLVLRRIP